MSSGHKWYRVMAWPDANSPSLSTRVDSVEWADVWMIREASGWLEEKKRKKKKKGGGIENINEKNKNNAKNSSGK